MTLDLDAILAKARAATSGRRRWGRRLPDGSIDFSPCGMTLFAETAPGMWRAILWLEPTTGYVTAAGDSDFAEAISPDAVIALVERLREAESDRDNARAQVAEWQARAREEWENGHA